MQKIAVKIKKLMPDAKPSDIKAYYNKYLAKK